MPRDTWRYLDRVGHERKGVVATPDAPPTVLPGILLLSEPFGLTPDTLRLSEDLAALGYIVAAPDLRQDAGLLACTRQYMRDLRREYGPGIDGLVDARTALQARADVDAGRIAVVGLCLGGGLAFVLAKTGLFQVAAPFYGTAPAALDGACPLIAFYGRRDRLTRHQAAHVRAEAERLAIPHEVHLYPDAGHSFLTEAPNRLLAALGPRLPAHAEFNPVVAATALHDLSLFLQQHL